MRSCASLIVCLALAGCGMEATPAPRGSDGKGDVTDSGSACSQAYWDWLNQTYLPMLDRPPTEVSDADLASAAALRPPSQDTEYSYGVCWLPAFLKYFYGPASVRLHQAHAIYLDRGSADYERYDRFLANSELTSEIRRNGKALLALRPAKTDREGFATWLSAYDDLLWAVVEPVGMPGLRAYENVSEEGWVVNVQEAAYLDLMQAARAEPTNQGAFDQWMHSFKGWLFGPPPNSGIAIVFNLPWEPGADMVSTYAPEGVAIYQCTSTLPGQPNPYPDCSRNGEPFLKDAVRSFVTRIEGARPAARSADDCAAWTNIYFARVLRALGDRAQHEPTIDGTDKLALALLEEVMPRPLFGLFPYESWLDLYAMPDVLSDAVWRARLMQAKPCVYESDLPAAKERFQQTVAGLARGADALTTAAPTVCP